MTHRCFNAVRWRPAIAAATLALTWLALLPGANAAEAPTPGTDNKLPKQLREVGFEQRLGTQLPLDVELYDESGQRRPIGDFFGEKPVVLTFVYYDCPMLCTLVLNGIVMSLRAIDFTAGEEFDIVAVSFDPREKPELARDKKAVYVDSYGRSENADGWTFLTGDESEIRRLTEAAGFRYVWDEQKQEYAHAAGIILLTPDGTLSRYLYGTDFSPTDLRLGLVDASNRKIGNVVDELLLYCFHYDPTTGQYSFAVMNAIRIGGAVTLLALVSFLLVMFRRERNLPVSVR